MKILDYDSQILVNKNNGELWNFYISNNTVFYRIMNNDAPIQKIKLIDEIKKYDIALDLEDNIHLICVTNRRELYYFTYSNNQWKKKIFKNFTSKSSIDFINILNIRKSIHIFYSFKNNINKNIYKIFHLHLNNNKWDYDYLTSITFNEATKPYFIDYNKNGDIFFLYKTITRNTYKDYVKFFSSSHNEWMSTKEIKLHKNPIDIINFSIDSNDYLQYIYKDNDNISLLYHTNDLSKGHTHKSFINIENNQDVSYKIFEANKKLWISWKVGNSLYYRTSDNFGKSWNNNEVLEFNNIYSIKYVGFKYKNLKISKPITTFIINKNETLYFWGFDNDLLSNEDDININNITEEANECENFEIDNTIDEVKLEKPTSKLFFQKLIDLLIK